MNRTRIRKYIKAAACSLSICVGSPIAAQAQQLTQQEICARVEKMRNDAIYVKGNINVGGQNFESKFVLRSPSDFSPTDRGGFTREYEILNRDCFGGTHVAPIAGDPFAGSLIFKNCAPACHRLDEGNAIGPTLKNIVGRKAGSAANYPYSSALKSSDLVWTEETLDKYLANPKAFIPGTKKFDSLAIRNAQDRRDIIAYISSLNSGI